MLLGRCALLGLAGWICLATAAAQEPPAVKPEAKAAALQDFRNLERTLEKQYKKCDTCKGKGRVSDAICRDCGGDKLIFTGTQESQYQTHIDNFIAYCELLDKHAAVLDAAKPDREHILANREVYWHAIPEQMSSRAALNRVKLGQTHAEYRKAECGGVYSKLACDLVVTTKKKMLNHGVAFDGTVTHIYPISGRALAEVRMDTPAGEARQCLVLVPPDAKWTEKTRVRIVGKLIDGQAERTAAKADADLAVVSPCYGTSSE
jgi:hypothetical protein